MEQVFPANLAISLLPSRLFAGNNSSASGRFKVGVIEKIAEPGHFIVALDDGFKIAVRGSESLKVGTRVQVLLQNSGVKSPENVLKVSTLGLPSGDNLLWTALIPLGFGGDRAAAKLEVFGNGQRKVFFEKSGLAVYFVFTLSTENLGEVQWSIHLKRRQVLIQVYASTGNQNLQVSLKDLVKEVEASLKKAGLLILTPTVFLKKPFKAPAGFQLNVQG